MSSDETRYVAVSLSSYATSTVDMQHASRATMSTFSPVESAASSIALLMPSMLIQALTGSLSSQSVPRYPSPWSWSMSR